MPRFFSLIFLISCSLPVASQSSMQMPSLNFDYDRCENYEYGGWGTISVRFQEGGNVQVSLDDYTIKSQYANEQAYEEELDRISNSDLSIMGKLDARAEMYDNTQIASSGFFSVSENSLKIRLGSDEILGTNILSCEIGGRYLMCGSLNFVLAKDEVIMDRDVLRITNVSYWELTFNEEPIDRWILHIENGNEILENGSDFLLESFYNPGQFLGHGRDGQFGLFPMDESAINYDFRFYDPYGEGPLDALEDLKFKPSYFFGDYSYIIGVDQETDNVRISKQFKAEQNLWYVEGAMCDIVDEIVARQ